MKAVGYLGLEILALSFLWGLPENEVAARIFAVVAIILFAICGGKKLAEGEFV